MPWNVRSSLRRLAFGVALVAAAAVRLAAAEGVEPARPLAERGLENLTAFARLYGYVRWFHPSDEAAAADWESLALAGAQAAEGAESPDALARALESFFRPVAPTLRVFPTGGPRPPVPAELAPPSGSGAPKVIAWRHRGVHLSDGESIYRNERVENQGERPAELPDPREPFVADLGGGVSALLPLSLFVDAQGTRPGVPAGVEPPKPAKPEGFQPTGDDRATRLAGVVIAWNVFQHFYPYFDVVETDWPGALRDALRAAATDPDRRAYLDTLDRLVARLHDGHGAVWHREMAWKHRLPLAWDWVEGELAVTHVEPEAAAAGLVRGDVVLSIDGRPLAELAAATEPLLAAATPQHRRVRLRRRLALSREPGEALLAVRHPDGRSATVRLPRVRVPGTPVHEEPRPETVEEVRPGIFYVDMSRIDDAGFREAVGRLAEARGVIFDLRGYPNLSTVILAHLTDRTVQSARWNVPVFTRPDREGVTFEVSGWPVEPAEPRIRGKAAFLTDGRAISYAETYLGIVEHYRLAEIVGGPTAGTNGNISPFQLPGGYNLVWTGMKVLKHDGSRHHGVGIQPTVPASRTLRGVAEGRDEVLEKAIEVVSRREE